MPTYALLGATGSTGSAILRCLLSEPPKDLRLNIFVRSASKVRKAFPDLEGTTAFHVNIIEGTPSDSSALQDCLKDVDVVFACIATNESSKDISLIQDTTAAIINASKVHRQSQGSSYKTPIILQLRSASLNENIAQPWLGKTMASFCFYYIYEDLRQACKLYESAATGSPGLLEYVFVDPPAIHDPDGTTRTGHKLVLTEPQEPILMYADLGAAFCELAERRDEFAGKGVGVSATGQVNATWSKLIPFMITGAKSRIWG